MSELGNHLRQARLEKNISLDDLQEITKIQKRYLIGIEEGNYSIMPGNFYVRAFIKQYAEAVDLDPDVLFEQYKNEIPSTYDEIPEKLSRVQTHKELPKPASKFLELLPKLAVIAVIILVAIIVWVLSQRGSTDEGVQTEDDTKSVKIETSGVEPEKKEQNNIDDEKDRSVEETDQEEKKEENAENETKQTLTVKEVRGKETVYELSNADKLVIDISTNGNSWIEVKNGKGKSFFAGMMRQNEQKTVDVTAEEEAKIVVGDARFTTIQVNGEAVSYETDPNKMVRQDIIILNNKNE